MSANVQPRALTVKQPWAWLIATGQKPVENRTWTTPYRGPLYIHAGAATDVLAWTNPRVRDTAPRDGLATRAVVAVTELVDVHPAANGCCAPWGEHSEAEPTSDDPQIRHWVLDRTVRLPEPVPAVGCLGLWTPSNTIEMAVHIGLADALMAT